MNKDRYRAFKKLLYELTERDELKWECHYHPLKQYVANHRGQIIGLSVNVMFPHLKVYITARERDYICLPSDISLMWLQHKIRKQIKYREKIRDRKKQCDATLKAMEKLQS